jgi:hypothetical protein
MKYKDLLNFNKSDLEILNDKIKNLSKYMLGKNEWLEQTFVYDPN